MFKSWTSKISKTWDTYPDDEVTTDDLLDAIKVNPQYSPNIEAILDKEDPEYQINTKVYDGAVVYEIAIPGRSKEDVKVFLDNDDTIKVVIDNYYDLRLYLGPNNEWISGSCNIPFYKHNVSFIISTGSINQTVSMVNGLLRIVVFYPSEENDPPKSNIKELEIN